MTSLDDFVVFTPKLNLSVQLERKKPRVKCPDCWSPAWKYLPDGQKKCRSCGKEFGVIV